MFLQRRKLAKAMKDYFLSAFLALLPGAFREASNFGSSGCWNGKHVFATNLQENLALLQLIAIDLD